MVIIRLQGGLGNQLFQYALYLQLLALGREAAIDDVTGFAEDPQREPVLSSFFGIDYVRASADEITALRDARMDPLGRIRRKLLGRRTKDVPEPADGNFDERVLTLTDGYLDGYWQSERYFPDEAVRARLIRELNLPRERVCRGPVSGILADSIAETESVSLHVRLGDYLWPGTVETYGGICNAAYYERAIARIRTLYPEAEVYVFCLDKVWARDHYPREEGYVVVDTGEEAQDLTEFWLMSRCRHHILANSSYSWWAAWLSEAIRLSATGEDKDLAPSGLVVAPARWLNNKAMTDIYTDRMIRV